MDKQFTEDQELENAAYLLRKSIQAEFISVLGDYRITPERVEWWHERLQTAFRREINAKRVVDDQKKAKRTAV